MNAFLGKSFAVPDSSTTSGFRCEKILEIFPYIDSTYPTLQTTTIFKGCSACEKYHPCIRVWKTKRCSDGITAYTFRVPDDALQLDSTGNPLLFGQGNVINYNGTCLYLAGETEPSGPLFEIPLIEEFEEGFTCEDCLEDTDEPQYTNYKIRAACCSPNVQGYNGPTTMTITAPVSAQEGDIIYFGNYPFCWYILGAIFPLVIQIYF